MYGDTVKVTGPNNYSATLTADDFDAESGSLKITDLIDMISLPPRWRFYCRTIRNLSGSSDKMGHANLFRRTFGCGRMSDHFRRYGVQKRPSDSRGDLSSRSEKRLDQKNIKNRLIITMPLLVVGGLLT